MRRGRVNLPVLLGGLAITIPLIVLLAVSFGRDPRAVPSVLVEAPAPDFTLLDLDGNPVSLHDYAGHRVVLNFWSTWCGPCRLEHPLLVSGPSRWPDARFLGVIYGDDPEKARRYLARAGSTYPQLVDPGGRVAIDYGVAGVPETYLIDEHGRIVHKQAGVVTERLLVDFLGGG